MSIKSTRKQMRVWLLVHLPDGLLLHPFEWFVALLCLAGGITTVFAQVESNALEATLPVALYRIWGVLLVIGGTALFIGVMSIKGDLDRHKYVITRVPIYKLGLRLLALSTTVYCATLIYYAGAAAAATACIIPVAFILTCGIKLLFLGDTNG